MGNTQRYIKNIESRFDTYVKMNGKDLLNLSSNDYLNVSTRKDLVEEFLSGFGKEYFFSSASARLLSGTEKIFSDLETLLAQMFNKEKALIFNTGYQCNLGVISALVNKGDVIFSDKLNHASIIDGMRLAGGDFYRYNHLDYEHLEAVLKKHRDNYKNAIIVSESIFSMDGDCADIKKLVELKNKYNCRLMIDEAHAFMVADDDFGGGVSKGFDVDIVTATFGKAVGSFGAFVVASEEIINTLINKSRSFIFTTSIPPINIAWTYWLLNTKQDFLLSQKKKLWMSVKSIHEYLYKVGVQTPSVSHIVPIILKDPDRTKEICAELQEMGFFVLPINPPTVPEGSSRIRLSFTANITLDDVRPLLEKVVNEI